MQSVLMCIPLKKDSLTQYANIIKQLEERDSEYREMLQRYDIHRANIFVKQLDGKDYAFVYHEVGDDFSEKIALWESSTHPFDVWMNEQLMTVYDGSPTESGATSLIDFKI